MDHLENLKLVTLVDKFEKSHLKLVTNHETARDDENSAPFSITSITEKTCDEEYQETDLDDAGNSLVLYILLSVYDIRIIICNIGYMYTHIIS